MTGTLAAIRIPLFLLLLVSAWAAPRHSMVRAVSLGIFAGWLLSESIWGLIQDYYGMDRWLAYIKGHWYEAAWQWHLIPLTFAIGAILHTRGTARNRDRGHRWGPPGDPVDHL